MQVGDIVDFYFNREIPKAPAIVVADHENGSYGFNVFTLGVPDPVVAIANAVGLTAEQDEKEFFFRFAVERGRVVTKLEEKEA